MSGSEVYDTREPGQLTAEIHDCPCGMLHHTARWVVNYLNNVVSTRGVTVAVSTPEGVWRVPRVFIAMHGLKAGDLPALAHVHGFEEVRPDVR